MKLALLLVAAVAIGFNCAAQDPKLIKKGELSPEAVKALKEKKDITISGTTGEIKGTKEDAAPKTEMCKQCKFPKGSLRQFICLQICADPSIDDETKKAFAEGKDICLSGATGEVLGSKAHSAPKKEISPKSGFPKGSTRDAIYHNLVQED